MKSYVTNLNRWAMIQGMIPLILTMIPGLGRTVRSSAETADLPMPKIPDQAPKVDDSPIGCFFFPWSDQNYSKFKAHQAHQAHPPFLRYNSTLPWSMSIQQSQPAYCRAAGFRFTTGSITLRLHNTWCRGTRVNGWILVDTPEIYHAMEPLRK